MVKETVIEIVVAVTGTTNTDDKVDENGNGVIRKVTDVVGEPGSTEPSWYVPG